MKLLLNGQPAHTIECQTAVAANAEGMYIHGTELGTPTAHRSARCVEGDPAVPDMGDIRRRTAHI